jgi:hypothetical protein
LPSETAIKSDSSKGLVKEVSADASLSLALGAIAEFTEAVALIQAAVAEIETKKVTALGDIETLRDTALADIQVKQAQAVAAIHLEKTGVLQAIQTAVPNIAQLVQNAFDNLFGKNKGY